MHNGIIGIPLKGDAWVLARHPHIEAVVQEKVRQQGRGYSKGFAPCANDPIPSWSDRQPAPVGVLLCVSGAGRLRARSWPGAITAALAEPEAGGVAAENC
jgi:hypothetical protein